MIGTMTVSELFKMVSSEPFVTIFRALLQDPSIRDLRNPEGVSPMAWAKSGGRPDIAEMFIDAGAELDFYDTVYMGSVDRLAELLPTSKHLINSLSPLKTLPLIFALQDPLKVRMLIDAGADVNLRPTIRGAEPPLVAAAAMPAPRESIEMLLDAGADPNAPSRSGWTALYAAAAWGDRQLVMLLLAHGARPGLRNGNGKSPAERAEEEGHLQLAEFLRAATGSNTEEIVRDELLQHWEEPDVSRFNNIHVTHASFDPID